MDARQQKWQWRDDLSPGKSDSRVHRAMYPIHFVMRELWGCFNTLVPSPPGKYLEDLDVHILA